MRGDGDEGDLLFLGTIVPKNPIRRRRGLLSIGLEDLLTAWAFQAGELVGLQTGVPGICGQELDRLDHGLVAFLLPPVFPQLFQVGECPGRPPVTSRSR